MLGMARTQRSSNICGPVARPWCTHCGTDEFLLMESVAPCSCGVAGLVGLSYSCLECEGFSAHCVVVSAAETTLALMVSGMADDGHR